jgi:NAD(P)-dependent dehydrogenase (short-subunit alcohol dehydrogenase family)
MNSNHRQTAIITGASSGIGLGLTKGFLAEGFQVVANSRRVTDAGTLAPSDDLLLIDGASLTKGGLNSVTRGRAIEYAAEGIRVNAIAPGIVDTPMHEAANHEALMQLHPIARLATVQEIVDAALFLARAAFITGEVLYVDGGAHAGKW